MDPTVLDWEPCVIRKVKTTKKTAPQPTTSVAKVPYQEENTEITKLKTISHEMAQFIIKSRTGKQLKQIELAKLSNLDAKIIADIERGGCVYNAAHINKIAKALGVNIPRK